MGSIKNIIKRKAIKFLSSFYDPLIPTQIGNQRIKIPMSHPLRQLIGPFPQFDHNLPRIIKNTETLLGKIKVIDIGANIGDTVTFIRNYSDCPILCIDGTEEYLQILRKNTSQYNDISVCHALVGAETKETNVVLKQERGTAYAIESKTQTSVRTLHDILADFPDFQDSKILKIDTDGYDGIILKGCPGYLEMSKPIIFFEFDPFLFASNDDDPFTLVPYLYERGYRYLIFYMSIGDYLVSCEIAKDQKMIDELVHFFSGREVKLYADICAFSEKDKMIFDYCVKQEIEYFKKERNY